MTALVALASAWTSLFSSLQLLVPSGYGVSAMLQGGGLTLDSLWAAVLAVLPVWVCGALVGLLLPRPKWLGASSRNSALLFTVPSVGFRRLALLYHAAVLIREVWCHSTKPGTFRRMVKGFVGLFGDNKQEEIQGQATQQHFEVAERGGDDTWYVGEKDLALFKYRAQQDEDLDNASAWELMCQKEIPNVMTYKAWRRTLHGGGTEYKSVTISADATAEEIMDMYLDDEFRPKWDNMIIHHDIVQKGDYSKRQLVVHWIRRFPFHFLSDREYLIARHMFRESDGLYAITKAIPSHPDAQLNPKLVQMEDFYSMWHSRTVECPWGSGRPASQTTLLHFEQFKIPDNLARFAVRHGMWGFVKNLGGMLPAYLEKRRARCPSTEVDALAYGADAAESQQLVAHARTAHRRSSQHSEAQGVATCDAAEAIAGADGPAAGEANSKKARRKRRIKGAITFLVATTLALACKRSLGPPNRSSR